ncbi:MAG TPA: trimethylamine methyltransferase family protein [Anaerolineales bacterium]
MHLKQPTVQILTQDQYVQIEETTFRLLEEVGIRLQHPRAVEMLRAQGCTVQGERVLIPRAVVAWSLVNIDHNAVFRSADGSREVILGQDQFLVHNGGSVPNFEDMETCQRRPARLQDLVDGTRILDALPNIDVVIPLVGPQDVPEELITIASFEVMLHCTNKPIAGAAVENPTDVRYMIELASACCGGREAFLARPTIPILASPISPLTFTEKVTSAILAIVDAGAAFFPLPAPTMGASGPITMAGVLAQQHAEVLASIVITAAAHPGSTVVYCSRINPIDMRTGVSWWGGPDMGMAGACATHLAHRSGLLSDVYGLCTSSAALDPRFAYEKFANALMPALAGADILSGAGTMDSGMTATLAGAVIDNEMISLVHHILRGYEVNEETLAFEVMKKVILTDDIFLGQLHTVKHLRDGTIWFPQISDSGIHSGSDTSAGVAASARARVRELLEASAQDTLTEAVCADLTKIMEEARRELVKS